MPPHLFHSGKKMRKIPVVPPKVGRILKIRKTKYVKPKPSLKKVVKKKEMRKKIMEAAEDNLTREDVTNPEEPHSSGISKILKLSRKKIVFEDTNIPSDHSDSSVETNAVSSEEEDPSVCSSDTVESVNDPVESSSHNEGDSNEEEDDVDTSDNDVITDMDLDESEENTDGANELPMDKNPALSKRVKAKAEFHHLSEKTYLLILRHPGQLYFKGSILVTPVSGVTTYLGYELTPGMKPLVVNSPRGISPMYFSTTGRSFQAKKDIKIPGLGEEILKRLRGKDSCLLIEPPSGEHWTKLIGFFNRVLVFNPLAPPKPIGGDTEVNVEDDLGIRILRPTDCNSSDSLHREGPEWDALSQDVWKHAQKKGSVRVMVFGGKGVGKSTLMRYLVNQWLNSCNASNSGGIACGTILFLDFDPGQSEFVPPGCLSVTLVSEPLLGPNYTHLKDPERMICLGDIDVSRCPKWYLYCAADLVKFCSSDKFKDLPWFINTMGFCKGIGADLAVELIRLCRPTHVVQLKSIWERRNFEPSNLLSWPIVKTWKGQKWNPDVSSQIDSNIPEYSYCQIQSCSEISERRKEEREESTKARRMAPIDALWGLPAWMSRELTILAYFSKMVTEPEFRILDPVPHRLTLPNLVFSLPSKIVKPQYVKSVFNASLVGLCNLGKDYGEIQEPTVANQLAKQNTYQQKPWLQFEERASESDPKVLFHMPLAHCSGFGLVRGIDVKKKEIYITTPLSSETMDSIDCLTFGPKVGYIPPTLMIESLKESQIDNIPYLVKKDRRSDMNRAPPRVFQSHFANEGSKKFRA